MTGIVTRISTMLSRDKVGEDALGNEYWQDRKASKMPGSVLKKRRLVLYKRQSGKQVDPSCVPPEWHAWLHHIVDEVPSEDNVVKYAWQKDHEPNKTGTIHAYRPSDTTVTAQKREDYQAWSPE